MAPLTGNALRAAAKWKCPECAVRLHKPPRTHKKCPTCGEMKPRSEWGHSSARPDHLDSQCLADKRAREARSGRQGRRGSRRVDADEPRPERLAALGSYSSEQNVVLTGVVESAGPRYGRVARGGVVAVQNLFTDDGQAIRKIELRDAYFEAGEPEAARCYLDVDDRPTFLTLDGSYLPGETATVSFDTAGNATRLTQVEFDDEGYITFSVPAVPAEVRA